MKPLSTKSFISMKKSLKLIPYTGIPKEPGSNWSRAKLWGPELKI